MATETVYKMVVSRVSARKSKAQHV